MDADWAFSLGYVVVGGLLVAMSLSQAYLQRLPLSAAMLYLLVGLALGPMGLGLLRLDPMEDAALLERLTEVAVVVSLFISGMKLDLPLHDRRWRVPLLLATSSMAITVGAITAVGVFLLKLPLGVAVLLGGILAPTDPVLASDVQLTNAGDRDRLRFGLTGEGGLNDGTAFPFVMLGLGLLGLHDLGESGWRWWLVDLLWASVAGLAIGWAVGWAVGRAVLHLRRQHREAWGSDEFISLGLIALAYGAAVLCSAYGFLAVFAAGLALGRADRQEARAARPEAWATTGNRIDDVQDVAAGALLPGSTPMAAVQRFNLQLERVAEVGVVLAVGIVLAEVDRLDAMYWFVPLLFVLIRPAAVFLGLAVAAHPALGRRQMGLMGWFGIRGIGSVYYLMYAISHGLSVEEAGPLVTLTTAVVVSSVVAHGISVTPLMRRYEERVNRVHKAKRPT